MAKALRYRLFGMGKMPDELTSASTSPDVLIAEEGVSMRQTVDGLMIPRARVRHGVKLVIGSVVVLPNRLLLSAGRWVIMDTTLQPRADGAAALGFAEDGIRVTFAVASVVQDGSGTIELHYRLAVSAALLARLPSAPLGAAIMHPSVLINGWKGQWAR